MDNNIDSENNNYLDQLADTFCFSGFSTLVLSLWFVYGSQHIILCFLINLLYIILLLFCIPSATHLDIFFYSVQYVYMIANLQFPQWFFVSGWVFMAVGGAGFCAMVPVLWLRKRVGESCGASLGSNRRLMVVMQILCGVFVNGYGILSFCCLNVASHGSRRLGVGLLGVLGGSSLICCILRLVSRWKEYHRAGARVRSITCSVEVV